jgi:hypothetical protein
MIAVWGTLILLAGASHADGRTISPGLEAAFRFSRGS